MTIDHHANPFSTFGAYLSLRHVSGKAAALGDGLYLRSHHGRAVVRREILKVELLRSGRVIAARVDMNPIRLSLTPADGKAGEAIICFDGPYSIRIAGHGIGIRLRVLPGPGVVAHPSGEDRWTINARQAWRHYLLERLTGDIQADIRWAPDQCDHMVFDISGGDAGAFHIALDEYNSTWEPRRRRSMEQCLESTAESFQSFLEAAPPATKPLARARELAAYVNWSAVVEPEGLLKRPAMFMSKNHMDQVWSWDHCFNALAHCQGDANLAWDQLLVMFDNQDRFGAIPDGLNDFIRHYNFCKPPIHGWALRGMMQRNPDSFTKPRRLREIYPLLAAWSLWWMEHRTERGQILPHYLHGNDSGWDNSTLFDTGVPLQSADLAAFLSIQLDTLADIAGRIGKSRQQRQWREASDRLAAAMIDQLWRADHFIGRRLSDGGEVSCDSLITCLPMVLGERLPDDVATPLLKRIRRHLTPHGLATELPTSPHYTTDGYWRGPIWAPPTMLIVAGLRQRGEEKLARTIATRFCRMCARSGFAENFNALTADPLRDRAYTWTSSVFLLLAN